MSSAQEKKSNMKEGRYRQDGETIRSENFVNIQMITSGKHFINHSDFSFVRIQTAFFREHSQLARMCLGIDQHKVIKGSGGSDQTACTIFPTFKTGFRLWVKTQPFRIVFMFMKEIFSKVSK